MIQEYYRQMRKFGCNILAVIQQYDIIKESGRKRRMIGNSKMLLKLKLCRYTRGLNLRSRSRDLLLSRSRVQKALARFAD